jgi:hypothetical protein
MISRRFYYLCLWEFCYDTAALGGFVGSRWEYWLRAERNILAERCKEVIR